MLQSELDAWHMQRALELAVQGEGHVEPNPMVGCVIARGAEIIGEGWHRRFGGPHAEVEALTVAGSRASGSTMYVTLEPCCHHGKTPPCSQAVIHSGIARVVVAQEDPFAEVQGQGLREMRQAGIEVEVGLLQPQAEALNAPYLKLIRRGQPWIIAKWAMTLDGKIATHTGSSRWISSESSREVVQFLRARVDGIMVGSGTALADDPLLRARPRPTTQGAFVHPVEIPRQAVRIVLDRRGRLPLSSQLVRTTGAAPLIVVTSKDASSASIASLREAGCEVLVLAAHADPGEESAAGQGPAAQLDELLSSLGTRRMTNVLVEGGGRLLGSLFDAGHVDEVHVFIAPKLIGGDKAPSPLAGAGIAQMADALELESVEQIPVGNDFYIRGRVRHKEA
jgi:diaminohydroxyphosphoribosylaminopyrimidine deaminase/5-amino-6-(5-phosphoribosylamino)uracil reductase